MNLIIAYRNVTSDSFDEKQLDCSERTIRGHANYLILEWKKGTKGVYKIDDYNAILLDEIIAVRVNP